MMSRETAQSRGRRARLMGVSFGEIRAKQETQSAMEGDNAVFYHMHIPKTAGTSLRSLLARHWDTGAALPALVWSDYWKLSDLEPTFDCSQYSFISGHFDYKLEGLADPSAKITRVSFLRHPTERALSFYYHILRNTLTEFYVQAVDRSWHHYSRPFPSLVESLSHPVFSQIFSDTMFRQFAVDYDPEVMRLEKHQMGPHFSADFIGVEVDESAYRKVAERLATTHIGLQEHFLVSLWKLGHELNLSLTSGANVYENTFDHARLEDHTAEEQELLTNLNRHDIWLYDTAVQQFEEEVSDLAHRLGMLEGESGITVEQMHELLAATA